MNLVSEAYAPLQLNDPVNGVAAAGKKESATPCLRREWRESVGEDLLSHSVAGNPTGF